MENRGVEMDELKVNPELCVDCGLCERNCPNNAIRVHDGVPLFCMHCSPEKAPCLAVCPKGAIVALGGAITIKQDKCIGCGLCHSVCPIGAITINEIGQATNVISVKAMTLNNVLKLVQLMHSQMIQKR